MAACSIKSDDIAAACLSGDVFSVLLQVAFTDILDVISVGALYRRQILMMPMKLKSLLLTAYFAVRMGFSLTRQPVRNPWHTAFARMRKSAWLVLSPRTFVRVVRVFMLAETNPLCSSNRG